MLRRFFLATAGMLMAAGSLSAQTAPKEPSPVAVESPNSPISMEDPQTGDHWTYEFRDDITGEVKSTLANTITDVSATDISIRIAALGNSNFNYVTYDRSWNRTSNDTWRFTPNDGSGIRLPLTVGKTWSVKATDVNASAGASWKRSTTSKVTAQETVTTRAGTFDTFKIEATYDFQSSKDPAKKFQEVVQLWYAPSIDHWVKQSSVTRSDGRVRNKSTTELVEYGRR
jgi:hypothetical protein